MTRDAAWNATGKALIQSELRRRRLRKEHNALLQAGTLHWFHWAVVVLSLVLTLSAWYVTKRQIEEKTSAKFDREAEQIVALITERMARYEDGLWAGVAAVRAHGDTMNYGDWRTFADSLRIDEKYPGINGIGIINRVEKDDFADYLAAQRLDRPTFAVYPEHGEDEYLPITYIEPVASNAQAVGLDMAHEANRYVTAHRARDTGKAQVTGPIVLVQDAGKTPGFLFYAPFYAGTVPAMVAERRSKFLGLVYAPFVVRNLMEGVLEKSRRQIAFSIVDDGQVLYDENVEGDTSYDADPMFRQERMVAMYGRAWTFDLRSTLAFREATRNSQPMIILVGGITIDAMLLTLFVMLSRANRRAVGFAARMTRELRTKAEALARSNAELEGFAYATSHDLKTPLRGIGDLTEYLEEDLTGYMSDAAANPDVRRNIDRLHRQVGRMNSLINGILDYSRIGSVPCPVQAVNLDALIGDIRSETGLAADQLIVEGPLPSLETHAVRLERVLGNLIGNAIKYHNDPANARVTLRVNEMPRFYRISVSDNGPGIDKRFHSRIFEVFQTLQTRDEVESTGIGLSIVKKIVESYGGRIDVSSEPGWGTTFTFDWPKVIEANDEQAAVAAWG